MIVKIRKKDTRLSCDNWRGISLLPTVAKILTKIIPDRVNRVGIWSALHRRGIPKKLITII